MVLLYYRCGIWETKKLSNLDKVILPWLKMARPGVNSSTPCNFVCSVTQSCPTLQPPDCSTPGFPVLHHLPELAQTQVHWVSDTIQSSHPLCVPFSSCLQSFPESESFPMSQFFVSGGQSVGASASALVLPMNNNWLAWSPCSPRDSQESSSTPQFKSINSSAVSLLYSPILTSIHDCWKNHSLD